MLINPFILDETLDNFTWNTRIESENALDSGDNPCSDAEKCAKIPDISGNGYDVLQATVSNQPTFYTANSKLTFDSTNNQYLQAANSTDADITGEFTMFVTAQLARTTGNNMYLVDKGNLLTTNIQYVLIAIASGATYYNARVGNGGTEYQVSSTSVLDTDIHVITVQYKPSTHLKIWVDSVLEGTNPSVPASITSRSEKLTVGSRSDASAEHMDGDMWGMPLIITGALSDTDRSTIEKLLSDKIGGSV